MSEMEGCPPGRVKLGNTCYSEDSWLNMLVIQYDVLTSTGDIKTIDKANDVITKALSELEALSLH